MKTLLSLSLLLILLAACGTMNSSKVAGSPELGVTKIAESTNTEPISISGSGAVEVKLEPATPASTEADDIANDPVVKEANKLIDKLLNPADLKTAAAIADLQKNDDKILAQFVAWLQDPATKQKADELVHAHDIVQPLVSLAPPIPPVGPWSTLADVRRRRREIEAGLGGLQIAALQAKLTELHQKRRAFRDEWAIHFGPLLADGADAIARWSAFVKGLGL